MEPSPGIFHSPRVRLSIIIALLIVIVAFFSTKPANTTVSEQLLVKDATNEGLRQDLDSDGLETWQEDLWNTDPLNPDTDGDGTLDGEEVRIGRIPTQKGPKDVRSEGVGTTTPSLYYDDNPDLSTTEVVSRDILSAYLAMKQSGTYSEKALQDLTDQIAIKSRDRAPIEIEYFDASEVIISKDTADAYRTYANTLGTIFAQFRDDTKESELVTFARAVETKNPSILGSLQEFAVSYATISKLLISTPVPENLANLHLSIANSYVALSASISYLQRFEKDPVVNIAGIELYSQAINTMNSAFPQIRKKLIEQSVTLLKDDPGASLFGILGQ